MDASEAIELLSNSELKQLGLSEDKKAIMGYINMGLVELHKRFSLWEETAVVTMVAGVNKYFLDGSDPNVTLDNTDHEFVMINSVFDKNDKEIEIDLQKSDYKISFPRYNLIRIAVPVAGDTLKINYRASPKFITFEKQTIPLPPQYFEALFNYVGYRAHASVNGDIKGENNTHFIRFDQSCKRIIEQGLHNDDSMEVSKLEARGFL